MIDCSFTHIIACGNGVLLHGVSLCCFPTVHDDPAQVSDTGGRLPDPSLPDVPLGVSDFSAACYHSLIIRLSLVLTLNSLGTEAYSS